MSDNKTMGNHSRTPVALIKAKLEALDLSQRTKGSIFEKLCQTILQEYDVSNEFEKIELWSEWRYGTARKTGIDFVITTKFGEYIAVSVLTQHSYPDAKRDIDLFFYFLEKRISTNASNADENLKYSRGIVLSFFGPVCLEKHRKTYLENQNCRYRTDVITLLDLVKTRIDWESVDSTKSEIPLLPPKKSSAIQERVFKETRSYLKKYDKGRMIFPDCDDKFLPLLRLIGDKDIVEENGVVLYLAQNAGQLIRVFTSFRRDRTQPFLAHFVYEEKHSFAIDGFSFGFPISMSSRENLKNAYAKAKELGLRLIVFATYSDLPMDGLGEFDFVIYDEAYSAIPEAPKKAIKDEEIQPIFNPFVDNECFSAKKRLFITPFLPKAQKPLGVSMTQASILEENPNGVFGEIICSFDVDTAQGYGLLTDFRLIVPIAIQEDYIDLKNMILEKIKKDKEDVKETQFDVLRIAKTTSLLNFFRGQNLIDDPSFKQPRNAILFIQKLPTSQRVEHEVEYIQQFLDKNKKKKDANIELRFIPNTCSNNYMERIDIFEKLEKESYNPCNIILNSHFFVEKIDNPPPDCVVLFDSQTPLNEATQLLLEALQNAKDKEIGYIVVPLVITKEAFLDANTLKRSSQFQFVREIVGLLDSMGASQSDKNLLGEKVIPLPSFCSPHSQDLAHLERIKNLIVDKVSSKDEFFSWGKFRNKLSDVSNGVRSELRTIPKEKRHKLMEELNASMNIVMDDADLYDLLSAHIIAKPILDRLYGRFLENDPIRKKIDGWLNDNLDNYSFVLNRCLPSSLIDDVILEFQEAIEQGKNERVLYEIYDAYQHIACKNRKRFTGVVPTPPQAVDFILRMTNDVLKKHFQHSFDDKDVKMYDPFAGRGEFFARMFEKESGFIGDARVEEKFQEGMFAQDLTILAYYTAIINISFSAQKRIEKLGVFKNVKFVDSLSFFEESSELNTQGDPKSNKESDSSQNINVIITNPPFLGALPSNNSRLSFNTPFPHPKLEEHISEIYCKRSKSKSASFKKNPLIQSILASINTLQDRGVISIVINEMVFRGRSTDYLRKTLVENFSHIYLFNFRGSRIHNLRGSLREEGGKIFNGGGKTADALLILVKNGDKKQGKIQYYEMEDGLSAIEKNDVIDTLRTLEDVKFLEITQDEAGDWLEKRDTLYETFIPLVSDTTDEQKSVFSLYSTAIKTGRDAWTYNFSQTLLAEKINTIIQRYNQSPKDFPEEELNDIPLPKKLLQLIKEKKQLPQVEQNEVVTAMYRPFVKQFLLWDRVWVDSSSKNPHLFSNKGDAENIVIYISKKDFCTLASKHLADYHLLNETIAFPLYRYESDGKRKCVITDYILQKFQQKYGEEVSKEDIFCYVYGLLHHRQYVEKYQESLKKVVPRIIFAKDLKKFVDLSKQLLDLHLDYEKVQMHSSVEYSGKINGEYFNVKKMILSKDKTSIQYNENIIIKNIPKEAYEYKIAGRSLIDWTIRRYQVTTDKQSQIENDPNLYMGNGKYVFDHICKMITLAVETVGLIDAISREEFDISLKISEKKLKKRAISKEASKTS